MSKGVVVGIPENIYVSYLEDRTIENEFYFSLYKQYQSSNRVKDLGENNILYSPTIVISGFEKLIKIKQGTPQEQKIQLTSAAKRFIDGLSFGEMYETRAVDWAVKYSYDEDTQGVSIIFILTGSELPQDFTIKFSNNHFVCNTFDTHNDILLKVHIEGFDSVFGDADDYRDYNVSIHVRYAPCITKFTARYEGVTYQKYLAVNPIHSKSVELAWEIVGNGKIEHSLQKGDEYLLSAASKNVVLDTVERAARYTLRADNQQGFTDIAQIEVRITRWHKVGTVSGLFDQGNTIATARRTAQILFHDDKYYCYCGISLYQSSDGCAWSVFSTNTEHPASVDFPCLVSGLYEEIFYAMSGTVGGRLKLTMYNFTTGEWSESSAYQNCISTDGSLAFSCCKSYYSQTATNSIRISGHDSSDDPIHWNRENFAIETDAKAVCSALCFWKDSFYSAVICDNDKLSFYKCSSEMEDAIFSVNTEKCQQILLLPTTNKLFIAVNNLFYDTASGVALDDLLPSADGAVCLGSNQSNIFGIFPDDSFWIYTV